MVVSHLNLRQTRYLLDTDATDTSHMSNHLAHLFRLLGQSIQVITKYLDGNILFDARQQLVVAHLYRLGNLRFQPWYRMQRLLHLLHQFLGRFRRGPLRFWLERHHDVGALHRHRVGRNLRTTDAAHHLLDLGILRLEQFLRLRATLHHLRQGGSLSHAHLHGEVALFQTRNELASEKLESHEAHAEQAHCTCDDILVACQHPV